MKGLCDICMPEAFCGLETLVERFCYICVFCERKKYPLWEKRISSMRERTPQRITCVSSHGEGAFYFSQSNTEEQNTQSFTETLSQPISQSVTANVSWKASVTSVCRRRSVGSKCAPKGSVNSVRSVREKTPSESQASLFSLRVHSISHRRTQMNRTHKVSQRR